jgi:hypothetical protein
MADQNNNDSDFEIDNEFVEDDSWPDDESAAEMPKKKKSGGMIVLLGGLIIIGAGAYYAKDILLPSTDVPAAPGAQTSQMESNPFAQNNMTADINGNDSRMAPQPENNPQAAVQDSIPQPVPVSENNMGMPGSTSDENMEIFGESSDDTDTGFPSDTDFESGTGFDASEDNSAPVQFGDRNNGMTAETPEFDQPTGAMPMENKAQENEISETGMAGMPENTDENGFAFDEDNIETVAEDRHVNESQAQKQVTAPAPEGAQAAASEEIEALNTRIENLEEELKTLQSLLKKQDPSQLEAQVAKLNRKINTLETNSSQKAVSASSRQTTATAKSQPRPRSTQQSSAPNWVLRSADSNAAWISVDGSNDIQKIVVGDTLEGLGEIRSIDFDRYQGWVVTGTKATITQ